MSARLKPPFRADHVGSLLRPQRLVEARAKRERGEITAETLTKVEDECILEVIRKQEEVGLKGITDGEFRRAWWHFDFMGMLDGLEFVTREAHKGVTFHGVKLPPTFPTINGKLDFPDDHPHLEHFKFLAANTKVTPKISIPGPSVAHYRTARADVTYPEYQDPEALFAALARTYAKAVQKFYEAGCRYLQMDDVNSALLCDTGMPPRLVLLTMVAVAGLLVTTVGYGWSFTIDAVSYLAVLSRSLVDPAE